MPYRPPKEIPEISIEDIWAWVARTLTDPASYKADVSALAHAGEYDTQMARITAARATLIDALGTPANFMANVTALLATAHFNLADFEQSYPIPNQTPQHWNDTAEHTMTTLEVALVATPTGATRIREVLMMVIDVMALEAPGGVNKIDVQIEARKAGGSWTTAWTEDDVMSLPDVDGARDTLVCIADATGLFDGAATYEFRAKVQASLAKDTQYLYSGIYAIRYKMD